MPELTPEQIKQYNAYRAEGMTPERALSLATKDADNKYNPALEAGVDNILFGPKSLTSAIGKGLKSAFIDGPMAIAEDARQYGGGFAALKAPLTLAAGAGRGIGDVVGGILETADDLTGETVSGFVMPAVEGAVNSDVGQYLLKKAVELDQRGRGIPGDILDATNLLGLTALVKSGAATSIKQAVINSVDDVVKAGAKSEARSGGLFGFLKGASKTAPEVTQIESSLSGIEKILLEQLDGPAVTKSLDEIKDILKANNASTFSNDVLKKIDDVLKDKNLPPEQRSTLESYVKNIEGVLNQEDASGIIESFISGASKRVDDLADKSVGVIEGLSDSVIDSSLKTIEKVRSIPAAISGRAKQAIDRRILRIAENEPVIANENIVDLYKRAIVPGVKKKNKTISNIKNIEESVKRAVPELAKKYEINDLEDFANAISTEKKAIFAEIEKGLTAAGEQGRMIDAEPIVKELDALLASERAKFSKPLRDAIQKSRAELVDVAEDGTETIKTITPSGAQDIIADLNAQLQAFYRGSTSGTNADVIVDNLVVNNLRKMVDDVVEDLGEGTFKELKSRYGDLKKMEDDVVHRAVFEAQKGGGLSDLTDVISAGDVAAGLSINPAFLAKGAAQFLTKEVIKSLSDKNELVRQMFLYGKYLKP